MSGWSKVPEPVSSNVSLPDSSSSAFATATRSSIGTASPAARTSKVLSRNAIDPLPPSVPS